MNKAIKIIRGVGMLTNYLKYLFPEKNIKITYEIAKNCKEKYGEWNTKYLGLLEGEEYFLVSLDDNLLYAVNVTGDSVLTAFSELMNLLSRKF